MNLYQKAVELMTKKRGLVQAVSRYNHLKIEDQWYEPTGEAQKFVHAELRNRWVELTLLPNSKLFSFLRETSDNEDGMSAPRLPDQQRLIVRQTAVKAVAEFAKAHPDRVMSVEKLLHFSGEIETWIMREGA